MFIKLAFSRKFCTGSGFLQELTNEECWSQLNAIKTRVLGSEWTLLEDNLSSYHAKLYYITLQSILTGNRNAYMELSRSTNGIPSEFQRHLAMKFKRGQPLIPGYEFIYCMPMSSEGELSYDGYDNHESVSIFNSDLQRYTRDFFKRRMWIGGDLTFSKRNESLRYGDQVRYVERVRRVRFMGKEPLRPEFKCFVDYERLFYHNNSATPASSELRRIAFLNDVFRPSTNQRVQIEKDTDCEVIVRPTHVSNMRVSSLTFNSHKVHYDRDYTINTEKYPDLIVEGPLLAGLLLQLFQDRFQQHEVRSFNYKIVSPTFVNQDVRLCIKKTAPQTWKMWIDNKRDTEILRGTLRTHN